MNRVFFILLGTILGVLGISIIIHPAFYDSELQFYFDFTKVKWPFGGALIILGAFFVWSSFRKEALEAEKRAKDEKEVYMCPKCVKPFYKKDASTLRCPYCQNPLEELSGFYERHPELEKKKIK